MCLIMRVLSLTKAKSLNQQKFIITQTENHRVDLKAENMKNTRLLISTTSSCSQRIRMSLKLSKINNQATKEPILKNSSKSLSRKLYLREESENLNHLSHPSHQKDHHLMRLTQMRKSMTSQSSVMRHSRGISLRFQSRQMMRTRQHQGYPKSLRKGRQRILKNLRLKNIKSYQHSITEFMETMN